MLCLTFQQSRGNVYSSTSALNYACKLGISENNTNHSCTIDRPLNESLTNQYSYLQNNLCYKKTSHFSSSAITHVIHLKRRYYSLSQESGKESETYITKRGLTVFLFLYSLPLFEMQN